ncbi:5-formyltetrahydrofolate cyclo-ligase [Terasakiella sp. A23]|uniref:5-formyltetrahydrofolate cyclo-ligase n=1 Tax=Terasakiella sp. FCG-A23 TaxID=3080561 RepID=UPI002954A7BC|nr:5-formyltetrahydrofolate cyclo-ligase [Terasakiella sp. A23]MDV7339102.1 5-formyltetrahydrofolate cyclo-ligase [Terasakiella sp. A23]
MSDISSQKANLRRDMLALRKILSTPSLDTDLILAKGDLSSVVCVAGYWPMAGELDIRPLFAALDEKGVACALPVVVKKASPLIFRQWKEGDELEDGPHRTLHPAHGAEITPDAVLVPLLAFDETGGRLGFGGGYYDRTLAGLKARRIGIAYDEQQVESVPMDTFDQKMDWIVTPTRVIQCKNK